MAKKIPQINASSMADISFLLLIFFLVTTSMDVNQGLSRRLPPPKDPNAEQKDQEIHKNDLMIVKINSANRLMVDGKETDVSQLKAKTKAFIQGKHPNDDGEGPEVKVEYFKLVNKKIAYTPKHVISVQNDVDTKYQAYLEVQCELVAAYNELRDKFANDNFGKPFAQCNEEQQDLIKKIYPQNISEAEPKNYN